MTHLQTVGGDDEQWPLRREARCDENSLGDHQKGNRDHEAEGSAQIGALEHNKQAN